MNKVVHENETFYGRTSTIIMDGGYGYVMVSIMEDNPDIAVIHDLVVHKDKRGEGIGRELLDEACKKGGEMGADFIMLSVVPDSWLEEWYKRHGFAEVGHKETVFGVTHNVLQKEAEK